MQDNSSLNLGQKKVVFFGMLVRDMGRDPDKSRSRNPGQWNKYKYKFLKVR
uniref:Uncharacterized protein n=1 Tax=Arundo donax TaxID=35708 RepID=A0A0A9BX44_ARUDO